MATKKVKKVVKAESSAAAKPVSKKKVVAKKKSSVSKAASTKKVNSSAKSKELEAKKNSYVIVDYPVENETIAGNNYVLRIGASTDGYVEVSFNSGEWLPCRFASGYWWFDWNYFKSGNVTIAARIVGSDGKVVKLSDIRKCKVS
ncbi:MAG: hypothetical protein J6T23_04045 [Elusimicrobia bacterium]|nr:hypothetical protein [Elusimicrobiota bacterium]